MPRLNKALRFIYEDNRILLVNVIDYSNNYEDFISVHSFDEAQYGHIGHFLPPTII